MLGAALEEQFGPEVTTVNAGVNGNTTRQALERIGYDVQVHEPDVVVVQFGLNDCNRWESDGGLPRVSADAFEMNLIEIVDRCRAAGAKAVIVNTNHPTRKGLPYDGDNSSYNDRIRRAGEARPTVVVSDIECAFGTAVAKGMPLESLLLADGVHISEDGHGLYVDSLRDLLIGAVGEARGESTRGRRWS
jgi:acyl-CoA thioesterase-1